MPNMLIINSVVLMRVAEFILWDKPFIPGLILKKLKNVR